MTASPTRGTERYLALDVLRGIAALAVVVYHWEHFLFFPGQDANPALDHARQPLYDVLSPFYNSGYVAVDLFFSLSGFIFFCFYARRIRGGGLSFLDFAHLRLSRLYPLHLLTLLLVVALQYAYFDRYKAYFVYQENDLKHFMLQLLFAVELLLPAAPYSFNGPIWSVSIEVLLYALFFFTCRYGCVRLSCLIALSVAGALLSTLAGLTARGIFSFFLGGICFHAFLCIRALARGRAFAAKVLLLVILAASVFILCSDIFLAFASATSKLAFELRNKVIATSTLQNYYLAWYLRIVVFPALIVLLALAESELKPIARRLAWMGDISYSSYLIHFPLQICFVLFVTYANTRLNFLSPTYFLSTSRC